MSMPSRRLFPSRLIDGVRSTGRSGATLSISALLLLTPIAQAGELDPPVVTVLPADELGPNGGMVCSPSTSSILPAVVNTITMRNSNNQPIADAQVVVLLTSRNPVCPDGVLTGVTDANGVCTITIAAGGCSDDLSGSAVIKANGVTLRSYANIKGPDFDSVGGDLDVDLSDLVAFADQFNGVEAAACHDYENDEDCDVADLVIFGAAFSGGLACP